MYKYNALIRDRAHQRAYERIMLTSQQVSHRLIIALDDDDSAWYSEGDTLGSIVQLLHQTRAYLARYGRWVLRGPGAKESLADALNELRQALPVTDSELLTLQGSFILTGHDQFWRYADADSPAASIIAKWRMWLRSARGHFAGNPQAAAGG